MIYQKNDSFLAQQSEEQEKSEVFSTHQFKKDEQLAEMLQKGRENCQIYILGLKEIALTPISQLILEHYSGNIKQNYSTEDIFRLIDKRISKQMPIQSRMIRNKKIKKNWNIQDVILLLWIISKYLQLNKLNSSQVLTNQDWNFISKIIPGSTAKGCMFKFISLKKTKLSLIYWSKDQEQRLLSLVQKYGLYNWKLISEILYQKGQRQKVFRTPKQCRQHWNCYLDPKLKKGPWSQQQDVKLLQNVRSNKGQRKWSSIKHLFQGRTQNALKNRYNLLIEKQKKETPQKSQKQLIKQYLKGKKVTKTINNNNNNQRQYLKKQPKQDKLHKREQIYQEELIDQPKAKDLFQKSQYSSFKLSQSTKKTLSQSTIPSPFERNSVNNILLLNLSSIYPNQQGFYFYKPLYQ